MFKHLKRMSEHSASLLLMLLLVTDIVFIVVHAVVMLIKPVFPLCNATNICAYMNIYHLIMLFWVVLLFASILRSTRFWGYLSWILVFSFIFIDDAFLLHQNVGDRIAALANAHLSYNGFPPRYYELAVLAIAGVFFLVFVVWAYFRSPPTFRKVSIDVLLFLGALVFFGIIVDLAEAARLGPKIILGLGIVEDSGEILIDSLLLWYVFLLAIRNGNPDMYLHDLVIQHH